MTGFSAASRSSQATKRRLDRLLAGRCVLDPDPEHPGEGCEHGVRLVAEQRAEPGPRFRPDCDLGLPDLRTEPPEENLDEGPARESAIGVTAPLQPRHRFPAAHRQLRQQACLADARRPDEENHSAPPGCEVAEHVLEGIELSFASEDR